MDVYERWPVLPSRGAGDGVVGDRRCMSWLRAGVGDDARKHQRAAVNGLSAIIEGSPGATARRHPVLNVSEQGMLIDGLVEPCRRSDSVRSRWLWRRPCRVWSRRASARQERRRGDRSLARRAGSDPRAGQKRDRGWPAGAGLHHRLVLTEMPDREHERLIGRQADPTPRPAQATARHSRSGLSTSAADVYLNCPRCGLAIAQTARSHTWAHCPRCLGRTRTRVEMFASTLGAEQLYANGAPAAKRYERGEPMIDRADRER